jgi:hypothetical protein
MSFTRRQNMQDYALAITRAYLYSQNIVIVPYKKEGSATKKRERAFVAQNHRNYLGIHILSCKRPSPRSKAFTT